MIITILAAAAVGALIGAVALLGVVLARRNLLRVRPPLQRADSASRLAAALHELRRETPEQEWQIVWQAKRPK